MLIGNMYLDPIYIVLVALLAVFTLLVILLFVMRSFTNLLRSIYNELYAIRTTQSMRPVVTGDFHSSDTIPFPTFYSQSPSGSFQRITTEQLYTDPSTEPTGRVKPVFAVGTHATLQREQH